MLAEASPEAAGRRMSAWEALEAYGIEILLKAVNEGQAALVPDLSEPAKTLARRRNEIGYTIESLARLVKATPTEVARAETQGQVSPIRFLEKLAPVLALDEYRLGFRASEASDQRLGVRLREWSQGNAQSFGSSTVAALAEAAWLIAKQYKLAKSIGETYEPLRRRFESDEGYGYPTWSHGYRLAGTTRERLGIGPDEPIGNLRRLVEDDLRIPLVETHLGSNVAGATISESGRRGIVVNVQGANENVWVRRMTLAHELGHFLWDPEDRLDRLVVDNYDDVQLEDTGRRDVVEVRANAFGIAFLAPPTAVDCIVRETEKLEEAVKTVATRFGVSVTAARRHVNNVSHVQSPVRARGGWPTPSDEWLAAEDYTNDYFPLAQTPLSRRGRFAWFVVRALNDRLISLDTAATLLHAPAEDVDARRNAVLEVTAPHEQRDGVH